MFDDLSASATSAGNLFSSSLFEVPIYQREYSWTGDEVREFWNDLRHVKPDESYFLGLVILTRCDNRYQVVDGQQRMLTLTLLVIALRDEARRFKREALADKLQADFLKSINYQTDEMEPRVILSGDADASTLERIADNNINNGKDEFSRRLIDSYGNLKSWLAIEIAPDPFKKLGEWASFIANRLYFAVFTHPDPESAYRVFEAINTRGRSLTTADLLKNYLISSVSSKEKRTVYERWQQIAKQFDADSGASFVQFIRHVVTVRSGHILPKQLYGYLARKGGFATTNPPTPLELLDDLEKQLPLYSQMVDPSVGGPADQDLLDIYKAFNQLSVITVRPILLALFDLPNCVDACRELLRLVVRRIVVGNLGTGNVERRLSEAAHELLLEKDWASVYRGLSDLNPDREEFISQLSKRSFNKTVLAFLRKSVIEKSIVPSGNGALHLIRVKSAVEWNGFDDEQVAYWTNTVGNTIISEVERRPREADNWEDFKRLMLPSAAGGELVEELDARDNWDADAVEEEGQHVAQIAAEVWYG